MKRIIPIAILCCIAFVLLYGGNSTVRPNADGTNSASFFKTSTSTPACTVAGTNCYQAVYETSGSSCASPVASDGATSYVYSATNGAKQSFAVDISGISNGDVITAVNVYTCAQRGASGNSSTLFVIISGTETDCGSNISATSSYASYNCSISVSVVKQSGTTMQIGVFLGAAKGMYYSTFAAVVTSVTPSGRKGQTIVASVIR